MNQAFKTSCIVLGLLCLSAAGAEAQGTTAFTYQGLLKLNGVPANGNFDFEFTLYDGPDPLTADPVGNVFVALDVLVVEGIFIIEIDFGPGVFDGTPLWLETRVREAGGGPLTSLFPLQKITAVPYSTFAVNSAELDGLDSTDFLRRTSGCEICIGHADNNGTSPTSEQCVDLSTTARDDTNFLEFPNDVDENDHLWLWLQCP